MKNNIITQESVYSFIDYFRLSPYIEEILAYFGYQLHKIEYSLPRSTMSLDRLPDLMGRLKEHLPYISFTNEMARREFLIAPVLMEVIHYVKVKIKVEWPLMVNEQLKGTVDYYIESKNQFLVIEAKNTDLESGFSQLAVELIALDHWINTKVSTLYGAVSTGNIWQFGILQREQKHIIQDLNLLRVPTDVEDVLRIIVAIVE